MIVAVHQCDELWAFCYAKDKQVRRGKVQRPLDVAGSVWTWTAIDRDTKLLISWVVGQRTKETAQEFIGDLSSRITGRPLVTSDGLGAYIDPMKRMIVKSGADYVQLVKQYGRPDHLPEDSTAVRYKGAVKTPISSLSGDMSGHNTSIVERNNLSIRMGMRRFTRRTNAHSKKALNHIYAQALYFLHYNFIRPHMCHRRCKNDPPSPEWN